MRTVFSLVWFVLILPVIASAQIICPAINPDPAQVKHNIRGVIFTCPDHAQDDEHAIDVILASDGSLLQTILGGDPSLDTNGEVVIDLNMQPVAFGHYCLVARAIAGGLSSPQSAPTETWARSPGRPTGVRLP